MKSYTIFPFLIQSTFWWVVVKPLTVLFAGLKVYGFEHIQSLKAPVILAPNHSNAFDSVLLPLAFPLWSRFSSLFYVVRSGKYYTSWRKFVFSFFNLEHIGAYAVEHNQKNYAVALRRHKEIIEDGRTVCIFPEGGITRDGLIRSAHGGVVYLAQTTQKPVVPVLISGTYKLSPWKFFTRQARISVEFFPPIYFKESDYHNDSIVAEQYRSNAERVLNVLRSAKQEPLVSI